MTSNRDRKLRKEEVNNTRRKRRICNLICAPVLFMFMFVFVFLAAVRPIHFIMTLGLRARVWVCVCELLFNAIDSKIVRCYGHTLHPIFQVHVPICAHVVAAVFTHKRQTSVDMLPLRVFLLCLCVRCAHDFLSISILIFISSKTSIALLQFDDVDVVVWRNFSMLSIDTVTAVVTVVTPFSLSLPLPSQRSHSFYILLYFINVAVTLLFCKWVFFSRLAIRSSWCDMKCLSNPIKASITHTHQLIDE